jgi:hypothetical protein
MMPPAMPFLQTVRSDRYFTRESHIRNRMLSARSCKDCAPTAMRPRGLPTAPLLLDGTIRRDTSIRNAAMAGLNGTLSRIGSSPGRGATLHFVNPSGQQRPVTGHPLKYRARQIVERVLIHLEFVLPIKVPVNQLELRVPIEDPGR